VSGSDEGRRHGSRTSYACCSEQLAATEFKVESGVLFDHGG